jgi:hypothetical protein
MDDAVGLRSSLIRSSEFGRLSLTRALQQEGRRRIDAIEPAWFSRESIERPYQLISSIDATIRLDPTARHDVPYRTVKPPVRTPRLFV